jgi:hypothetical protein|tara:strand:+ start:2316 stop:2522 length:207 start_codon:yes stop_codon:yes gene_type:complete
MKDKSKTLDKGAIPRITQEIYYEASTDGSLKVNAQLCISEFMEKLNSVDENNKLFDNIDKAIEEEINK